MVMKPATPTKTEPDIRFDYENQAWIIRGRYIRCGHHKNMNCKCYGKLHEGEEA